MARLRKASFNGTVEFVTTSVERGVLLPCNPLIRYVILAALIRAQEHNPVEICHFIVEGTHVHMLVVINNPEDLPGFMERFKTESAHYINRLLGREGITVWKKGYDSPTLLTPRDVVDYIAYLYTNPVKDGLSTSIKEYPGLSSWGVYQREHKSYIGKKLNRDSLFKIPDKLGYLDYRRIRRLLERESKTRYKLELNPDGWMKCFDIEDSKYYNELIEEEISKKELELSKGKTYRSRVQLESEGFNLDYVRKLKKGRRLWCICRDIPLRKRYISFVKYLSEKASGVYKNWRLGDFSEPFPAGMFPPKMRITSNLLLNNALREG